jgi:hypothetical protein
MNGSLINGNRSIYRMVKLFSGAGLIPGIILTILLGSCLLMAAAQASEPQIDIVDTWVEDGNLFHVAFEAQPINANCSVDGEGIIEFGVAYHSQGSSGIESVFGVAGWYPASDEDTWIETQGLAYGPIALCTKYTPCRIKEVNIVKTYCPDSYRPFPLYSREDWFH